MRTLQNQEQKYNLDCKWCLYLGQFSGQPSLGVVQGTFQEVFWWTREQRTNDRAQIQGIWVRHHWKA